MSLAVFVRTPGGPEQLDIAEHDPGAPRAGELRVRIAACGVNFIDVYHRSGLYPRPLPFVLGLEGAGEVEALGAGVTGFAVGERVAWAGAPGSYAGSVNASASVFVKLPSAVPSDVGAAAMLQGMTAHYLVHACRDTQPGDTALVHAAAGGVGLLLIQSLKAAGARVLGTCSSGEKESLARGAGADDVVRYDREDFAKRAREFSGGAGMHVVYDAVGKTTFEGSLASLRPRGLLCMYGQSSGVVPAFELNRLAAGSFFVTRPGLAHYTATREELEARANAVLGAVARGELSVRIGARFPLERAAEAHRALESRATAGKLLLIPG